MLKIIHKMESKNEILIKNSQLLEYRIFTLENIIAEQDVIIYNLKYKNKSKDSDIDIITYQYLFLAVHIRMP